MSLTEPSSDALYVLKLLQELKGPTDGTRPGLLVERDDTTSPPSNTLYEIGAGGQKTHAVASGILDEQLQELSRRELIVQSPTHIQLSEPGSRYAVQLEPNWFNKLRRSKAAFLLALAGSAASIVALVFVFAGPESTEATDAASTAQPQETISTTSTIAPAAPSIETTSSSTTNSTIPEGSPELTSSINGAPNVSPGGQVSLSGSASYQQGVHHIEAALQRTDPVIYWNPEEQVWQERFRVFSIPVSELGANEPDWEYSELLPSGTYQFRTWARGTNGSGEDGEVTVDFSVDRPADPSDEYLSVEEAQALSTEDLRDPPGSPKTRFKVPINGALVSSPVRIRATAESEEQISSLTLTLKNSDGQWWNFETTQWQSDPAPVTTTEDEVTVEAELDGNGSYEATAETTTASGTSSSRTNQFQVFES